MPQNYAEIDPPTQLSIMETEVGNAGALMAKGDMWTGARDQITKARDDFATAAQDIKPHWKDGAHDAFNDSVEITKGPMNAWAENLGTVDPGAPMRTLATELPKALEYVRFNVEQWKIQQLFSYEDVSGRAAENMLNIQRDNGRRMSEIDQLYVEAAQQVEKNGSGPPFQGVSAGAEELPANGPGATPGGGGGGGPDGAGGGGGGATPTGESPTGESPTVESPTGESPTGESPTASPMSAESAGGGGDSAGGGAGGGGGATPPTPDLSGGGGGGGDTGGGGSSKMSEIPNPTLPDPSLSGGLGSSPVVPPNLSTTPSIPTPHLPNTGGIGGSGIPPIGGGGGGLGGGGLGGGLGGGIGGAGAGPGGTKSALPVGLRNPGATPPGFAPTAAGLPGAATGAGASGAGGVPPMMPPMGGMGGGGSGGAPGSGAAQRAATGKSKRRDDGRTPGMPAMLGGRTAGPRQDPDRQPQAPDTPTTKHIIDEDLWQVSDQQQARRLGH